jgi:predicted metal-dependent hydrolase
LNKLRITKLIFPKEDELRLFGEIYNIKYTGNIRGLTYIDDGVIYYSGLIEHQTLKLTSFIKDLLLSNIKATIKQVCDNMDVKPRKISIRLCKTRWGSCNNYGDLSFNLLLIIMPMRLIEYVIIHELAHIKEMNHSIRFWKIVEEFCPDYKRLKHELKERVKMVNFYG